MLKTLITICLKKIKQLDGLKGYLVFPCFCMVFINFIVLKSSLIAVAVGLLFFVRILLSRNKIIQFTCIITIVISLIIFFTVAKKSTANKLLAKKASTITAIFRINPNSIKVNGESVKMQGESIEGKQKYIISYYVKTEKEQLFFKKTTDFINIKATVDLTEPQGKRNLGSFDYKEFLNQQQIYQQVKMKQIISISKGNIESLSPYLSIIRSRLSHHIDKTMTKSVAMYVKSLFLGLKDQEFKRNQEALSQLGILHFFSISGLHVFFFLGLLRYIAFRLGMIKEHIYWLELVMLFCFFIISGSATSVGRSVCYSVISLSNARFKLAFSQLDCWALTLIIFLISSPYILMQAGGIFSFSLTFFMIYLNPICSSYSSRVLREVYFSSCLTLFSIPTLCYFFYEWNVAAFVLTLLLVPIFSTLLLPMLVIVLIMSFIYLPPILLTIATLSLNKLNNTFDYINQINLGKIMTGKIPIGLYLLTLIFILIWLGLEKRRVGRSILLLAIIVLLPSAFKWFNPIGQVAFVDVGQGSGLVIDLPFHKGTVLIDTGGEKSGRAYSPDDWRYYDGAKSQADYTVIPFLKSRGVTTVDKAFITHGHADHYGNLLEINKVIPIKQVLFPKGAVNQVGFSKVVQQLIKNKVEVKNIMRGVRTEFRGIEFNSLYPIDVGDGANNDSLVMSMRLKDKRFLLMGDLEKEGEDRLLGVESNLKADILSVGHHGSKTSSSTLFLKQVRPQVAIISCGLNNKFGHPNEETLISLKKIKATVYRTDQEGMIYFNWNGWSSKLSLPNTVIE
ncbi:DNA internalization-related competence protein ComEC/Rec2 [Vagococcus fessus]|uniref:DNA internalization-related competence protein ComEC/Rec2 n=1 Tax=Vagococcus fessus TaxID=120370 RepID=A0A430A5K6_9ENTE|nr:DNA internalization-related competence protein ComEC/Rec2 [Vagococcus fessus]RSU02061.1 DNA internalization-related competence protein ComEC/Rec2 [Vagococcus fessus]